MAEIAGTRIVLFGPDRRIGVWENDEVIDAVLALEAHRGTRGTAPPSKLADFIAEGDPLLAELAIAREESRSAAAPSALRQPVSAVVLRAPWPKRRIAAVGSNYAKHSLGMRAGRPGAAPTVEEIEADARAAGQWGFFKVSHDVLGPDQAICYPSRTQCLDYEGELAVVIGRAGRNISRADALQHVWGVTLFNDVSIRDDDMGSRPMSYNFAKNFDGSAAIGPAIAVAPRDVHDLTIETRVNGELRQQYSTSEMIFPFDEVIEYLSRDFTLVPGDVISGGTSAGTAQDSSPRDQDGRRSPDRFLKPGDVVEISSSSIGTLRNTVER